MVIRFISLKSCTSPHSSERGFFTGKIGVLNLDWHSLKSPYVYQRLRSFTCLQSNRVLIYPYWCCSWFHFCFSWGYIFALPGFFEAHARGITVSNTMSRMLSSGSSEILSVSRQICAFQAILGGMWSCTEFSENVTCAFSLHNKSCPSKGGGILAYIETHELI